jgi:hypothetical protein
MTANRWAKIEAGSKDATVSDDVLADRWNGAMWPGGNASALALRFYDIIDEMAGAVARVDMKQDDGAPDGIRDVLDMDGLERLTGEWILERVAKATRI